MTPDKADESIVVFLVRVVKSVIEIYGDIFNLAYLETRLAGKSIFWIFGLLFLCVLCLFTTWIFSMLLFFFWLFPILGKVLACFIIVIANIGLIASMLLVVKSLSRNLEFAKTRAQLEAYRD